MRLERKSVPFLPSTRQVEFLELGEGLGALLHHEGCAKGRWRVGSAVPEVKARRRLGCGGRFCGGKGGRPARHLGCRHHGFGCAEATLLENLGAAILERLSEALAGARHGLGI